jgi:alpha-tubulin suppressor-like RCC1 family protein/MoxR-like ATPase
MLTLERKDYVRLFPSITQVISSTSSTFILYEDGSLYAAGLNSSGQLGLEDNKNRNVFTPVTMPEKKIKQFVTDSGATFVLSEDGQLYATGWNSSGQLGLGNTKSQNSFTLVQMPENKKIKQIVADYYSTFVLSEDGCLYATGFNSLGQLGLGDNKNRNVFTPIKMPENKKIKQIVADYCSTFVLSEDGCLYATGWNSSGQLGLGDNKDRNVFTPIRMPENKKIKQFVACETSTFFLSEDGCLYATGFNSSGQLGLGDNKNRNVFTPIKMPENKKIKQFFPSQHSNFVLSENGQLYATGFNKAGRLGLGDNKNRNVFTPVTMPEKKIKQIVRVPGATFVLFEDGGVYVSGFHVEHLGSKSMYYTKIFTPVVSLKDNKITQLFRSMGTSRNEPKYYISIFALSEDGALFVAGANIHNLMGLPYIHSGTYKDPALITKFIRVSIPSSVISIEHIFPKAIPLSIDYSAEGAGHIDAHRLLDGEAPFLKASSSQATLNKIIIPIELACEDIRVKVFFETLHSLGYELFLLNKDAQLIQLMSFDELLSHLRDDMIQPSTLELEFHQDRFETWNAPDFKAYECSLASIKSRVQHLNLAEYHLLGRPHLAALFNNEALKVYVSNVETQISQLNRPIAYALNKESSRYIQENCNSDQNKHPELRAIFIDSDALLPILESTKKVHIGRVCQLNLAQQASATTTQQAFENFENKLNTLKNFDNEYKNDSRTSNKITLTGDFVAILKQNDGTMIPSAVHRTMVYNTIIKDTSGKIIFKLTDAFQKYNQPDSFGSLSEIASGHIIGKINKSNRRIPIPTISHEDILIYTPNLPSGIAVEHCAETDTYCLINNSSLTVDINFSYQLFKNKLKTFQQRPVAQNNLVLEPKITQIEVKNINDLITYCRNFKMEGLLPSVHAHNSVEYYQDIIKRQYGACSERSQAFILLASVILRIPARLILSNTHAWVEYFENNTWTAQNLGGIRLTYTLSENIKALTEKLKNITLTEKLKKITLTEQLKNSTPSVGLKITAFLAGIILIIPALLMSKGRNSRAEKLKNSTPRVPHEITESTSDANCFNVCINNFLIILKTNQFPRVIALECQKNVDPEEFYAYIDRPFNLIQYWSSNTIDDEGKIISHPGILQSIVEKGGVIVINWSAFSAAEMASAMGLLDHQDRRFNGKKLHGNVKVIGLITQKECKELSSAFLSRCKLGEWSLVSALAQVREPVNVSNILHLYELPNWRDTLFGEIKFSDKGARFVDCALQQILTSEKGSLMIVNPPNDVELDEFLYRYNHLREFLWQGKLKKTPKDSYIYTRKENLNLSMHKIKFEELMQTKTHAFSNIYYLNPSSYWNFFKVQKINAHGLPESEEGWLYKYKTGEDIIDITGLIETPYWNYFLHIINSAPELNGKSFLLRISSGSIQGHAIPSTFKPRLSRVKISSDVDAEIFINVTPDLNIPVHPIMEYTALMEVMIMEFSQERIPHIVYKKHDMLTTLLAKKNVVLRGDISPTLFQQLLPLLHESGQVHTQASMYKTNGLYLVLPKNTRLKLDAFNIATDEQSLKILENDLEPTIANIVALLQKLPYEMGCPTQPLQLTRELLKKMVYACENNTLRKSNPLKPFFLHGYPKESDTYAFMNVVCKILLPKKFQCIKNPVNHAKLYELRQKYRIESEDVAYKHQWKILNCFSSGHLKNWFSDDQKIRWFEKNIFEKISPNTPLPALDNFGNFYKYIKSVLPQPAKLLPRSTPIEKYQTTLSNFLDSQENFLMLKGHFGVGKTHLIREVLSSRYQLFDGVHQIIPWLESQHKHSRVLLIDEMNTLPDGTWHFLLGLEQGAVYYQGKNYTTHKEHKVIFTGNPETYPGRYRHQLLQQGVRTLWMKSPQRDLVTVTMKEILRSYDKDIDYDMVNLCVDIYFMVNALREYNYLSLRDAKNFAHRINYFLQKEYGREHLYSLAMQEFYYSFVDKKQCELLKEKLNELIGISTQPLNSTTILVSSTTDSIIIPSAHSLLHDTLKNTLKWMKENTSFDIKRGILLEGASGVGKSSLLKYLLKDLEQDYVTLYGGTPNVCAVLKEAFHEGQWVLIDEMNIEGPHKDIEELLLQYLTGVDEKGAEPKKLGFTLLATQNSVSYAGRAAWSLALLNRLNMIFMPEYDKMDLIEIATGMGISEPQTFVQEQIASGHVNIRKWVGRKLEGQQCPVYETGVLSQALPLQREAQTTSMRSRAQYTKAAPSKRRRSPSPLAQSRVMTPWQCIQSSSARSLNTQANGKDIFRSLFPEAMIGNGNVWGINACLVDSLLQLVGLVDVKSRETECLRIKKWLLDNERIQTMHEYLPLELSIDILNNYFQQYFPTRNATGYRIIAHRLLGQSGTIDIAYTSGDGDPILHLWHTDAGDHFDPVFNMPANWLTVLQGQHK